MYIYSLEGVNVHLRKYAFSPVAILQTPPCAVQFALCSFHVSRWRGAVCTRRGENCTASFWRLLKFMLFCVCVVAWVCVVCDVFFAFAYRCLNVHLVFLFVLRFVWVCLCVCCFCLLLFILRSVSTFVSLCLVVCCFLLSMMFYCAFITCLYGVCGLLLVCWIAFGCGPCCGRGLHRCFYSNFVQP